MFQYEAYNDPIQRPRYTGLPTFMRAPYREDLEGLEIGLVGVPFDGGVTNRTGARHGPREIRNQSSLMRRRNHASGIGPHDLCSVADVGDAWVQSPFELEKASMKFDRLCRASSAGSCPYQLGEITLSHCQFFGQSRLTSPLVWFILTRTAIPEMIILALNFIMGHRFVEQSRKDWLIQSEPFKSEFEGRSTISISGSLVMTQVCGSSTWRSFMRWGSNP